MGKLIDDVGLLPRGIAAAESWRQEFTVLRNQRVRSPHPLGELPLIALERSDASNETWHAQQVELAALSSSGKLIKPADSGHMIHLFQPDSVVQAIRDVVTAAKRKR